MKPLGTATTIRGKLALAGFRSVSDWAARNGVNPVTARRVIYVWGNRADREPHGGISRDVMRMLRDTLSEAGNV